MSCPPAEISGLLPSRPPLVSVVVPVYQVRDHLSRCVESILLQSHRRLQVILVDDGSTDGSSAVCDSFAHADSRVEVVHQPNLGLGAARNEGIRRSVGEWVTFVDSDDWLHPDMVSHALSIAAPDVDMAVVGYLRVSGAVPPPADQSVETAVLDRRAALRAYFGNRHTLLTIACAKLFRDHLFESIRFPVGRLHEDEATTFRLLGASRKVAVSTRPLYYYYYNPHGITGSGLTLRHRLDMATASREQLAYFSERGDHEFTAAATATLLRKQVQLYWSSIEAGEDELATRTLEDIRYSSRRLPLDGRYAALVLYSRAFVLAPRLSATILQLWHVARRRRNRR